MVLCKRKKSQYKPAPVTLLCGRYGQEIEGKKKKKVFVMEFHFHDRLRQDAVLAQGKQRILPNARVCFGTKVTKYT